MGRPAHWRTAPARRSARRGVNVAAPPRARRAEAQSLPSLSTMKSPKPTSARTVRGAVDQQHDIDVVGIECLGQAGQRQMWPVQPERIAVDHEKRRIAQHVQRGPHPAAGVQQRTLAAQHDARPGAGGEVRFQPLGLPERIDHHSLHAGLHQGGSSASGRSAAGRPAAAAWLRRGIGQRAHAHREAGGQQHGGGGGACSCVAVHAARSGGLARRAGGIQRSMAAASGAAAGSHSASFSNAQVCGPYAR